MTYNLDGERTFAAEPDSEDAAFGAITDHSAPIDGLRLKAALAQDWTFETLPALGRGGF
jgi:hypothetical protein